MQETNALSSERPSRRFLEWFPRLDRDGRLELLERAETGARGDVDFYFMMALAATLASLGLLQDSTAVVIGAMLVAPLMGPLVAAGLALVQGNARLFRTGVGVTCFGVGLGFAISLLVGALNPGFEPAMEIEARGEPDVLDLGIALASGMAAAYASARHKAGATLAGVAIAAALVPPLTVIGIALTNDRPYIAGNAAVLLVTNLVAIILGAALVFRMLGVHESLRGEGAPTWARRATMLLVLCAALLIAPLVHHALEIRRMGSARPLLYPVAPRVRYAVKEFVEPWPEVNLILMGRTSVEPETGIAILLSVTGQLPLEFEEQLRQVVLESCGEASTVRLFLLRAAREGAPGRPLAPPAT
ncbi:MAG: DUF389 domain-containing protein [Planctomycetota bacterium]|jgi:uncharacterized hydrophobic protein (TIGR00271 family)